MCQNYPQCNVNRCQWLSFKWKTLSTCKDTAVTHLKAVWQVPSNKERSRKQGRTLVSLRHCVSSECWRFLSSLWRTWLRTTCPTQKWILKAEVTKYNVRRKREQWKEKESKKHSSKSAPILDTHTHGGRHSVILLKSCVNGFYVCFQKCKFLPNCFDCLKKKIVQGSPQFNSERQTYVGQQQFHHFQSDRAGPPVGVN